MSQSELLASHDRLAHHRQEMYRIGLYSGPLGHYTGGGTIRHGTLLRVLNSTPWGTISVDFPNSAPGEGALLGIT